MNTGSENRVNLERIVATLVKNLGDELFPSASVEASVWRQLKSRDFAVGYVDVSAFRDFLGQRIESVRSVCSLSDLNDLISDGMRSTQERISEACRLLQDVLSADDATSVEDLYEGRLSFFLHGRLEMPPQKPELISKILRRRGLEETQRKAGVSFHIVHLDFGRYAFRHAGWLAAYDDVEASGCAWKYAAATSQRILLLTACRYRHAYHHLFAIMERPESTLQSAAYAGCVSNMDFPAWRFAENFAPNKSSEMNLGFLSLDRENTGIVVPTDDTFATTSCAGVSRAFFGEGRTNPMQRQMKEHDAKILLFSSPYNVDLSAHDEARPISVSQTSRLFFGTK